MRTRLRLLGGQPRVRAATRAERGQALVVIAMAMIGLLAFVGLTVDTGILFIGEGHLRRAVDAAALASAAQFRVGRSEDQLYTSAGEVLRLNGVGDVTYQMTLCNAGDPGYNAAYDETLVHPGSTMCSGVIHKKLVKVQATVPVRFAFLSIIGIPTTNIIADAVSETASVDVVLVIDTSNSMTFDVAKSDPSGLWDPAVCNAVSTPADPTDLSATPYQGNCQPFNEVKHAAVNFVHHLYYPFDRLAIVTFDNVPTVVQPLTSTLTPTDWENTIKGLQVSPPRDPNYPGSPCTYQPYSAQPSYQPDPSACTNTSTGGGLKYAGGEFGRAPIRQESVWVVILLTDGAANASEPNGSIINKYCPPATWWDQTNDPNLFNPFCRDYDKTTRHTLLAPSVYAGVDPGHATPYNPQSTYDPTAIHYDADDYARDNADFVGCPAKIAQAPKWCRDSLNYLANQGGQGAVIFSIGLGKLVIDNSQGGGVLLGPGNEVRINPNDPNPTVRAQAGYDAGDALLRYVANVGLDGNPDPSNGPDPCQGVAPPTLNFDTSQPTKAPTLPAGNLSYNCGNYYFSQTGTGLNAVFQSIAGRIFTRITQ